MEGRVGDWVGAVDRAGFAVVPGVLGASTVSGLDEAIDRACSGAAEAPARGGRVYALRDLLRRVPRVRHLAGCEAVRALVEPVLGPAAFAVRGLLFDKVPGANWGVAWHQDVTIAVGRRREAPGFGPWTLKEGIPHVQPPAEVLGGMLTVRVHLDDCGSLNGPLRVVPGSHAAGRLDARAMRAWLGRVPPVDCLVGRGGVVLMRPLLLHASSAALDPGRRRVVHLEFAADALPASLEWFEAVGPAPRTPAG